MHIYVHKFHGFALGLSIYFQFSVYLLIYSFHVFHFFVQYILFYLILLFIIFNFYLYFHLHMFSFILSVQSKSSSSFVPYAILYLGFRSAYFHFREFRNMEFLVMLFRIIYVEKKKRLDKQVSDELAEHNVRIRLNVTANAIQK